MKVNNETKSPVLVDDAALAEIRKRAKVASAQHDAIEKSIVTKWDRRRARWGAWKAQQRENNQRAAGASNGL